MPRGRQHCAKLRQLAQGELIGRKVGYLAPHMDMKPSTLTGIRSKRGRSGDVGDEVAELVHSPAVKFEGD